MMKIQQSRLASLCGIAAAMVTECRLMITESGINTLAVDTENVGMVSINLPKEQFEEFSEAEKIEIGMDI
jgi:proliferating cell nuclear antigen